jgi:hypothetical protein
VKAENRRQKAEDGKQKQKTDFCHLPYFFSKEYKSPELSDFMAK